MNQITRAIAISGVLIIVVFAIVIIIPYVMGYIEHMKECNSLKETIVQEQHKFINKLVPIIPNMLIDKYNQECL